MERVVFKNSRGLSLVGYHHPGRDERVIIMCHGYGGDKEFSGKFIDAAESFNAEGYGVLRFDFSGCGESDDDLISIGRQVDDLESALTFTRELGYKREALLGYSMGGLIALKCWNPKIETLILWAPVTERVRYSWDERFSPGQLKELEEQGYTTVSTNTPFRKHVLAAKELMEERESIVQADLLSPILCPVLIIHGDRDERVPFSDSEQAAELLGERGELKRIEGGFHGLSRQIETVIAYSLQHLKRYFR